jgi:hypothetical protein
MIEHLSDFLREIGVPNLLVIGIVMIVLWLLISGLRKGLRKGKQNKEPKDNNKDE